MRALRFVILTATAALTTPAMGHVVHRPVHHASASDGIVVPMDEARVVTFQKPVSTVFIGNPSIADATIIDSRHAYVLGKTFGATNLIGLDADHQTVVNSQITVANRTVGSVTLNRGAETYNYSCTRAHCETGPRPGDPNAYVINTEGAATTHEDAATKAAAVTVGSNQ
ncbi:MAG TPA: pilus assembly protein N-terminal domain-containing protein [Rhizomicrobium sp.]